MANLTRSLIASGNINPSTFVKLSGTDFTGIACGNGDRPFGISQAGQKLAPVSGASTVAAADGDHFFAYTVGSTCYLTAGSAFSEGAYLGSDSSARGIPVAATAIHGAIALESASAAGELVRVQVKLS